MTFSPDNEWTQLVLILAQRYGENLGVFIHRGEACLEQVKHGKGYVWTTEREIARRKLAGIAIPSVPPLTEHTITHFPEDPVRRANLIRAA